MGGKMGTKNEEFQGHNIELEHRAMRRSAGRLAAPIEPPNRLDQYSVAGTPESIVSPELPARNFQELLQYKSMRSV
jgi:hypothetical protein